MNLSEKKTQRQGEGIITFRFSSKYGSLKDGSGVWAYPTGFGKTHQTVMLLKLMFERRPDLSVIVQIHRHELREQWYAVTKLFPEKNIGIYTANEIVLHNEIMTCDLFIADELHRYYGPEFMKTIDGTLIKWKWNLGLSATPHDREERYKIFENDWHIVDEITEEEALREGYISKYNEYNLALVLNEDEKLKYDLYSKKISENLSKFGQNPMWLAQRCLTGGLDTNKRPYNAISWATSVAIGNGWSENLDLRNELSRDIDELWNPNKVIGYAKILMGAVRDRANLLYDSQTKIDTVVKLTRKFSSLKTMCFSQSISFADNVGAAINKEFNNPIESVVYHTKLKAAFLYDENGKMLAWKNGNPRKFSGKAQKKYAIDSVKENISRVLVAATALDDGLDIPDLRLGITASRTSNATQKKQRDGRIKRVEDYMNSDIEVLLINLYFRETKDEDWLREAQKTAKNPIYWANSIDEIVYEGEAQLLPVKRKPLQFKIDI